MDFKVELVEVLVKKELNNLEKYQEIILLLKKRKENLWKLNHIFLDVMYIVVELMYMSILLDMSKMKYFNFSNSK